MGVCEWPPRLRAAFRHSFRGAEADPIKKCDRTVDRPLIRGYRCCTMVGLVENALIEIKEKYRPDRIIIESRWVLL